MRILVIEDDYGMRMALKEAFAVLIERFPSASVILTATLEAGLKEICVIPAPDVTILDLGLPGSTWRDTLARIAEFDDFSPVIIVSGHPEDEIRALLTRQEIEVIHKDPTMWKKIPKAIMRALARFRKPNNFQVIDENLRQMKEIIANATS